MNLFHFANIVRMKDSNVKSSLLVNCSVKLVKKKWSRSHVFTHLNVFAVQENPTSSKRFPTISFRFMFNISHIRKREIWKFYEETLKSYPRIFFYISL